MSGFDNQGYWERRLREHYSLEGVGYLRLGRRYNEWMYRVRGAVFDEVVRRHLTPPSPQSPRRTAGGATAPLEVLDVGAGTGFYIERWLALGASVTGIDLTEVAVERLREKFPAARFVRADIGQPLTEPLASERGRFAAVSAFDVLFHVVDDTQYARALGNIAELLEPGGLLFWSDNFIHQPTIRVTHQVSRSLSEATAALETAGLEIVSRVPMFVLMNYPADTRSRLARWAWTAMVSPALLSDRLGGLVGALLYPLERRLTRTVRESPSTELMVCRRR
jgi:2-polyprenyl-3-methyl-5-hydroxy-6-metoxy-1,4-benzoquinol methylase